MEERARCDTMDAMSFDRPFDSPAPFSVCFVCTGNICRSPMAAIVFREIVRKHGCADRIVVTSAATGDWHVGERADARTLAALAARGYDGSFHRAKQFESKWFQDLDLVVAFDRSQERTLKAWATSDQDRAKIHLLLGFETDRDGAGEVPDPYYSDAAMFDSVLSVIERACIALFRQVEPAVCKGVS